MPDLSSPKPIRRVVRWGGTPREGVQLGLGITAPVAVLALAYALYWISDRLLYIGPLDRAWFGWLVVVPLLLIAPVPAGLAWSRLTLPSVMVAAAVVATSVAAVEAALFWLPIAHVDCQFGSRMTPAEAVGPSLIVGLLMGVGYVLASRLVAALVRRGHPWWGSLLGMGSGLSVWTVTLFAGQALIPFGLCQRPPI
jgi:hypothetical protein